MPSKSLLLVSRKVHLYFGLFISPALLFFAITGAFQTLGLHEASSDYKPAGILAELGQLHKKQTPVLPVRRGQAPEGSRGEAARPRAAGDAPGVALRSDTRDGGSPQPHDAASAPATRTNAAGALGNSSDPARSAQKPDAGTRAPANNAPQQASTLAAKQKQHLPMKIFFVLVSIGLFTSTLTGIWMAFQYDRNPVLVTGLLLAGIVIPLLLLRL